MELDTMMWIVSVAAVIGLFALIIIAVAMADVERNLRIGLQKINEQLENVNSNLSGNRDER